MHDPVIRRKLLNRADQITGEAAFLTMQPDTFARRLWAGWTLRAKTVENDSPLWVFHRPDPAGSQPPQAARWAVMISFTDRFGFGVTRQERTDALLSMIDASASGPDLVEVCKRLSDLSVGMMITRSAMLRRLLVDPQMTLPELHDPGFRMLVGLGTNAAEQIATLKRMQQHARP